MSFILRQCKCAKNSCTNKRCSCKKNGTVCTTRCSCKSCKNIGEYSILEDSGHLEEEENEAVGLAMTGPKQFGIFAKIMTYGLHVHIFLE